MGNHAHERRLFGKAQIVNNEMKAQLNRKSLKYNWHEADVTVLEGVFARGDRRVAKTILEAYKLGCLFDSWTEYFDNESWDESIFKQSVDI